MAEWRVRWSRTKAMLLGRRREDELADEIELHLEHLTAEYVRRGLLAGRCQAQGAAGVRRRGADARGVQRSAPLAVDRHAVAGRTLRHARVDQGPRHDRRRDRAPHRRCRHDGGNGRRPRSAALPGIRARRSAGSRPSDLYRDRHHPARHDAQQLRHAGAARRRPAAGDRRLGRVPGEPHQHGPRSRGPPPRRRGVHRGLLRRSGRQGGPRPAPEHDASGRAGGRGHQPRPLAARVRRHHRHHRQANAPRQADVQRRRGDAARLHGHRRRPRRSVVAARVAQGRRPGMEDRSPLLRADGPRTAAARRQPTERRDTRQPCVRDGQGR